MINLKEAQALVDKAKTDTRNIESFLEEAFQSIRVSAKCGLTETFFYTGGCLTHLADWEMPVVLERLREQGFEVNSKDDNLRVRWGVE